jgi:alpha-L-fucosidase
MKPILAGLLLAEIASSSQATVLYQDNFDRTGVLNGSAPSTDNTGAGAVWIGSTYYTNDGSSCISPQPWQTDTCISSWHYDQNIFKYHYYKSAASVIRMLADIVSKNGNLMLSVPLRRDGQPDADEITIVSEVGACLKVNGEAIYATCPWKIFGEGPSAQTSEKGQFDGHADVSNKPFTSEGVRFTQSKNGKLLFAIVLEIPKDGNVTVKSLAMNSEYWSGRINRVHLVAGSKFECTRDERGLHVKLPEKFDRKTAFALKIQ